MNGIVTYPGLTGSIGGNTAGATALISSGTFLLAGGNNITLSQNLNSVTISAGVGGGPADGFNNIAAGTQTANTTGTVLFQNSNGVTFGMSNSSVVTASHNALTSQSNQALSAANGSFTFQTATFADSNGVSFSTGTQGIFATVKTDYLTSQSGQAFSAQGGSSAFQTLSFANSNGISFTNTNGSVAASYTVPTVTNSSMSVSDAATSGTLARLAFTNLNGVTLSLSTGAGGSHTIVGSHNALTSQSNQALSAGNGSFTFQTATFADSNGISFSTGTQGVYASHNALTSQSNQAFSAGGGSSAFQTLSFRDTLGMSWSNTGGQVGLASLNLSLYAVSNTTQSSSGTQNHSALSFGGAGGISVGVTNGSVVISGGAGGTTNQTGPNIAAGTQTATSGTVVFSNSNNISFGMSNSSIVTASFDPINIGASTFGNTAGTTGTVDGAAGQYILVATNNLTLSQSTNGASSGTLTIVGPTLGTISQYQNIPNLVGMVTGASAITQTSGSSVFVQPFILPEAVSASWLRLLASYNDSAVGTAGTTSANTSCSVDRYTTIAAVVYSQGVGANSLSIQSVLSSSAGITGRTIYTAGAQGSQYTVTIQKTYPVTGGTSSYSSSYAVSSGSIVISSNSNTLFTGPRFLDIPFATSLSLGNYWLGIGASTSSASNSSIISFAGTCAMPMSLAGVSQSNVSVGLLGAATSASANQLIPGLGVWTTNASNISTGSIGINSVSQVVSNPQLPFQLLRFA